MNLIPISQQYLRLNDALPFGLRDANGQLLLAAGARIDCAERLDELQHAALFADERESSDWRRRLGCAMDAMLRQNVPLHQIMQARPDVDAPSAAAARPLSLAEQWTEMTSVLDGVLRDLGTAAAWQPRLATLCERIQLLGERKRDASLYHLIYHAGHTTQGYSSHHALLCVLVAGGSARLLGWAPELVAALERAALTMNVSIRRLQDMLAAHEPTITRAMRSKLDQHAEDSAQALADAGVADPTWLEIVRLHHDDSQRALPLAELSPAQQAARLLRRVDIFTAKLSRRARRVPASPVQAAREACLGANGAPDEIGGALLRSVGLYPPGSFVELASGEIGIVIACGQRANLPIVASLVTAAGQPLGTPALRDTQDSRYAVKGAVRIDAVKVIPPHDRLILMI